METFFLLIACAQDALAVGLNPIRSRPVAKVILTDVPQIIYLGFLSQVDRTIMVRFAQQNGYAFQLLTPDNMKDLLFAPGTYTVSGDRSIVPWLEA